MFGTVNVNWKQLSKEQTRRYGSFYCGICRRIRQQSSGTARLALSYDMVFLAMLLTALYEPEEQTGRSHCMLHIHRRDWTDNEFVRYAADMNVALGYYHFLDDWRDDGKLAAGALAKLFSGFMPDIRSRWPKQCAAIEDSLARLQELEQADCRNPDEPAGVFGELMASLFVCREDMWSESLADMGRSLGRFIYLMDAMMDYDQDRRHGRYNPFNEKNVQIWEEALVLTMARCTRSFEKLPIVRDKDILDNILYSGVWSAAAKKEERPHGE